MQCLGDTVVRPVSPRRLNLVALINTGLNPTHDFMLDKAGTSAYFDALGEIGIIIHRIIKPRFFDAENLTDFRDIDELYA